MGLYDRDYYGDDQGRGSFYSGGPQRGGFLHGAGFGRISQWSFTTWIIVINVVVFILDAILLRSGAAVQQTTPSGNYVIGPLTLWGSFSLESAIYHGQIWRFLTFQFLHGGWMHIFFNMLALYFFGPIAESYLGSRRYLAFYLLSGMAGALLYVILNVGGLTYGNLPFLLPNSPQSTLVGASAGIFAVLMAAAYLRPNDIITLLLMFIIPIRMRVKTLAYGLVVIAIFTVFMNGSNAGGQAGHLGGAAFGAFLIRRPNLLNWALGISILGGASARSSAGPRNPSFFDKRCEKKAEDLHAEVDRILGKVGTHGLQSLTTGEKKTLERASEIERRRNAG